MSEGDADQLSIACTLLTRTSQRRYNQPNIAMDTTATYASLPSVAFHEERKPACGAETSSYKRDGQALSGNGTRGQELSQTLSFAAEVGGWSGKLWCAPAPRRVTAVPSGSSCLIWLVIAPISVCALQYKGRSPSWRAASLNVHRSS